MDQDERQRRSKEAIRNMSEFDRALWRLRTGRQRKDGTTPRYEAAIVKQSRLRSPIEITAEESTQQSPDAMEPENVAVVEVILAVKKERKKVTKRAKPETLSDWLAKGGRWAKAE